ncbi:MAG: hypothetical protein V4725_09010 [Bacteroidota bacterium]
MLSYFLIGLYAVVMVKPIMPQLADCFAHVLNYSDHVRIVHQEKGVLHVHYEYAEQAKKDRSPNASNEVSKQFNFSAEHLIGDVITSIPFTSEPQEFLLEKSYSLPHKFSEKVLPPPRS